MKLRLIIPIPLFGILLFMGLVSAQPPPPALGGPKSGKPLRSKTIRNLPQSDWFVSEEGRFKIALPKSISGFGALSPKENGFEASGASYQWSVQEGRLVVTFLDFQDAEHADTYFSGVRGRILKDSKGKLISERPVSQGAEFIFEPTTGDRLLATALRFENTVYIFTGVPSKEDGAEKLILSAFTSFSTISNAAIEAQLKKLIQNSTPQALPQVPVSPKEQSDAQDEGLAGRIKTVTEESEDRSGTWGTQGRKMSAVEEYNEAGFLTKLVSYDSLGKPFQITVYGYLDGARVSNSKMISYDSDPPLMALGAASSTTKRDNRYQYEFQYKYADGLLQEEQLILNNGDKGMRYVTKYQDQKKEELVYDEKGELNMKFVYTLDDKGKEVERTDVDLHGLHKGDQRYNLRYESFDNHGNWTKRVTSKAVQESGKSVYKDWFVTYRTIAYH